MLKTSSRRRASSSARRTWSRTASRRSTSSSSRALRALACGSRRTSARTRPRLVLLDSSEYPSMRRSRLTRTLAGRRSHRMQGASDFARARSLCTKSGALAFYTSLFVFICASIASTGSMGSAASKDFPGSSGAIASLSPVPGSPPLKNGFCRTRELNEKDLCNEENQSTVVLLRDTVGRMTEDVLTTSASPRCMALRDLPSKETHAEDRLSSGTSQRTSLVAGSMSGRKDKECGQIGVSRIAGTLGWTMLPPADMEYAVEPVGVLMMSPSAWTVVRCAPST
mmetsp:Transcript_13998/g.52309  ORF Transcript_13998/g.52309 Transcript_13998/m.52309 type:complete len:282 (-) Transcript_13998:888-1733(-)